MKSFLIRTLFLFCFVLLSQLASDVSGSSLGTAGENNEADWPYQLSDLQPDPSLVRGVLDNGFRYIIKENHEPHNRVAAYLAVLSGSLEETDEQQGLAHFLEHMMFNGSNNFPPGTLVDYFQSIGMDFGSDINAFTSFERTVYYIVLPYNSNDDLVAACTVLADYAQGALLLEEEIDKERGVILSEKRLRDSASYRNYVAHSEFAFQGTRYPLRFPIGVESVLKTADRRLLKEYYDSWYRPDNMILVLVGDLDPEGARQTVITSFGDLKQHPEPPEKPDYGSLERTGFNVFYRYEPELGKTDVSIETFWDVTPKTPLRVDKKDRLVENIGVRIVNDRLQRQGEQELQPYATARYSSGEIFRRIGHGSIRGVTDGAAWEKTLESLYSTIETIRLHGVSKKEVERAKNEIMAELTRNVQTESSANSRVIARDLINHLVDGDVYMSPRQKQKLYSSMLGKISVEDVSRKLQEIWNNSYRLVSVTGDVDLGETAGKDVEQRYKTITKTVTVKQTEEKIGVFPYLEPLAGTKNGYEKRGFPDLEVTRYTFDNGLVLNLKKTDFEENKIRISAHFGQGKQEEEKAGMAFLANNVINSSGTNTLSRSELNALLAGSSVHLSFQRGELSSSWSGSALSEEADLLVQVLQTMLLDAGFEEVAFDKVMLGLELMYKRFESEIRGAIALEVHPFLAGNNPHYGLPSWETLRGISYQEAKLWAENLLAISDLEISVVGDFDEADLVTIFNRYLGGLTLERPPARILHERIIFPEGERIEVDVPSKVEKSTLLLTWPTDDFWDIDQNRRLHLLAAVLEERVRKKIREELGASYGPRASSYGSRIHDGYGFIQVEVDVEPQKEEYIAGEIKNIVRNLSEDGVTDEELDRAKKPFLNSIRENIKTNQYWLHTVLSLSLSHPEQLVWPTTIISDVNSVTVKEVNQLAKKYLQNMRIAEAVVRAGANTIF